MWSESLTIYDPVQEIANRLEAESEGDMDRLTERDEYGNADIVGVDSAELQLNLEFDDLNKVTDALNRLAAYEDSGLSPDEVLELKEKYETEKSNSEATYAIMCGLTEEVERLKKCLAEHEQAKAEGRLLIIPDGYEYAKEFYHVVNAPLWCVEDGWGCEDCPYEEEVGNTTDCKFKPYVSRLKPNTVLKAMYVLRNLFLSKEAADQALSTCNTTGESEHRRSGE